MASESPDSHHEPQSSPPAAVVSISVGSQPVASTASSTSSMLTSTVNASSSSDRDQVSVQQERVWITVVERGMPSNEIVRKTALSINPDISVDDFLREVYVKLSPMLDYCAHHATLALNVNGRVIDPMEKMKSFLPQPLLIIEAPPLPFAQQARRTVGTKLDEVTAAMKAVADRLASLEQQEQQRIELLAEASRKKGIDAFHSVAGRMSLGGMPPSQVNAIVTPLSKDGVPIKYPVTWLVIACSIGCSAGGLLLGYDNGIAGGVLAMPHFRQTFFPSVVEEESHITNNSIYCKYANPWMQLVVSSLFITAMMSSLVSSRLNPRYGRKAVMATAGIVYMCGTILLAGASPDAGVFMLVLGRIIWGIGVGLINSTAPIYLSEMAPPHLRGTLNILFQVMIILGITVASFINYAMNNIDNGWRWSWGLGAIPGLIVTVSSILLPNSPSSLIELGKLGDAHDVLIKIRGNSQYVDVEYQQLVDECKQAALLASRSQGWRSLFTREMRCSLLVILLVPTFQQLCGINVVIFYAPQLFEVAGLQDPLVNAVINNLVGLLATFVSLYLADKVGRRKLLMQGALQMAFAMTMSSIMFGTGAAQGSASGGKWAVFFSCFFVAGFSWSWGPIGWLIPTEITPLEMRSVAMSIATTVNFLFTALVGQVAMSLFCAFRWGFFLLWAFMCVCSFVYVWMLVPETKGLPLEKVMEVVHSHWFWGRSYAAGSLQTQLAESHEQQEASAAKQQSQLTEHVTKAAYASSTRIHVG